MSAAESVTSITAEDRVRVRIEHSKTQRDGWGYLSTVEVTQTGPIDMDELRALLAEVRFLGESERDIRNARDTRATEQSSNE